MKDSVDYVLNNYKAIGKVDSTTKIYDEIVRKLPKELKNIIKNNEYVVKGSVGKGQMCVYPFVAVMDRSITTTTQEGLYIVYLFKSDLSGFYLSLGQGITNFRNLFGRNAYKLARRVAEYFRNEINDDYFSKEEIDLGKSSKTNLGKGYAETNIISKYYEKDSFTEEELLSDFDRLVAIYEDIINHMNTNKYENIINNVLNGETTQMIKGDEALAEIKEFVDPHDETPYGYFKTLVEVKPTVKRDATFKRLTNPNLNKIDYIKKNYNDQKTGVHGEGLALDYEKNRLIELGREDLAEKVLWVSTYDDSKGYDIESFNIDDKGKVSPLRIEVKTSTLKVDTDFFVSKNELETSRKYKNSYCVYRIYNSRDEHPNFYKAFGKIEDNFFLDPATYRAKYKYKLA